MKVLSVKGVEEYGNLWAVRYTRLTGKGIRQGAAFLCVTEEEATEKYQELVDILEHQDGVYLSKKVKKKGKTGRRKRAG